MNLQKIKERVSKYKEEIDEAEEREIVARTSLIEAEANVEKTLDDVGGLKRRLVLLRVDLEKTQERVDVHQKKLDTALGRTLDNDEKREEFELTERERDDELIVVEEECVSAKKVKDEAHLVMVEVARKLVIVEAEFQRAEDRCEAARVHVEKLEGHVEGAGEQIRDLEGRDWEAAEREILSGEKLKFLEDQLRQVTETYEEAEREARKLDDLTGGYRSEVTSWEKKTKIITGECQRIEEMADEEIEAHSTPTHHEPKHREEEPQEEQPQEEEPQEEEPQEDESQEEDED